MQCENQQLHSLCPMKMTMGRRKFVASMGASALAAEMGLFNFVSSMFADEPKPTKKPVVRVAFARPNKDRYWMGWPGAAYDIKGHQQQYTKVLTIAAKKFGVDLEVIDAPLHDSNTINTFLGNLEKAAPDGIMIVCMSLNEPSWGSINHIAKNKGKIPMVVFSPLGTSFTRNLKANRKEYGITVGATQDVQWLAFGLRMLNTIWQMKNTRILIVDERAKPHDRKLDVIGTTLHYITDGFAEEFKKVEATDEVRAMADYYTKNAKKIVEPSKEDILTAAKNYFVCRRLMAAENCQGMSMNCLGPIRAHKMQPPCLAFSRLRDEGMLGTCEADWEAAVSTRLTNLLFDRPGFMQDPAPNTVNNTLMVAHCVCATKIHGFDKPPAPFILRSHSESDIGVATQVLWPVGQKVTIMEFQGPGSIILGTGRVLRNNDTPPSGGCRTSFEIELDGVPDSRDTKGFHQLIICGTLDLKFKSYCQLAGIKVVHI